MKVTFGALLGTGKIPQMFVVPLLFNHYPLIPRGAMRPKAHSVLTVYASRSPNEAARA